MKGRLILFIGISLAACLLAVHSAPTRPIQTNAAAVSVEAQSPLPLAEDPRQIWDSLQNSFLALDPSPFWRTNRYPSQEVRKAVASWQINRAILAAQLADQSRDYYRRFPDVTQAKLARESEYNLLEIAVTSGNTNLLARLNALDPRELSNPSLTADERFNLMAHIVERNADCYKPEGIPAVMDQLEKGSRELLKAYPDNPQSWQFLVTVADQSQDPEKARRLAREILDSKADENLKMNARIILFRLMLLGNPLQFQGVALDGKPIDLSQMKGDVVLFHFWDTGCSYCVDELPEIKALYKTFHSQGLDIISVSFDEDKESLIQFLAQNPMEWPQYFAGPDWNATHGRIFNVTGAPSLWLVDRQGNLRDTNARENLTGEVKQLLKEPPPALEPTATAPSVLPKM